MQSAEAAVRVKICPFFQHAARGGQHTYYKSILLFGTPFRSLLWLLTDEYIFSMAWFQAHLKKKLDFDFRRVMAKRIFQRNRP